MKPSRALTPGLKHLAFFEALADATEETPAHRAAMAGLLTLRLVDHWVLAGAMMVEPESVSVRSVRQAIMAIAANDPQREVLLGVVNTMQTLREVDVQPVLPRMFAYAGLLEKRGMLALAADAYETVIRHGDGEYDGDLVIDSHMRLGFCLRNLGDLSQAEKAYAAAGTIAKRRREPKRMLRSEIGLATLHMMRGNLPKADEMLVEVADRATREGLDEEYSVALHSRSVVAQRRGELNRAVCLAHDALRKSTVPRERETILGDLGAFLIVMKRYAAARDALTILEATATTELVRSQARVNLLVLAARTGDRDLFTRCRASLEKRDLAAEAEVNFLVESARGLRRFGEPGQAVELLRNARDIARICGLNRSLFEVEAMIEKSEVLAEETASGEITPSREDPAAHVMRDLRRMAAALAA